MSPCSTCGCDPDDHGIKIVGIHYVTFCRKCTVKHGYATTLVKGPAEDEGEDKIENTYPDADHAVKDIMDRLDQV